MRLICPSCGAQYEVDESVIPEMGRDVQCSNCGHAWFQQSAAQLRAQEEKATTTAEVAAPAVDEGVTGADEGVTEAGDAATPPEPETATAAEPERAETPEAAAPEEPDAPPAPGPGAEPAGQPAFAGRKDEDDEDRAEDDEDGPLPHVARPRLRRRKLDESVLDLLREEADRESRVRKVEETLIESQPDLGLAAVAAAGMDPAATRDRVVRVRGDEDDLDDDALVARASRRELLPDIEAIKSTLRATSERGDEPAAIDAPETIARRQRSGFRGGFTVAIVITMLAVIVYLLAPSIARLVPALEPALAGYVDAVNAARLWLDQQLQSLTAALQD